MVGTLWTAADDPGLLEPERLFITLLIAAAIGLAVGMERQLHVGSEEIAAGARTYSLYTVWGAAAAYLGSRFGPAAFAVAAFALVAVVVGFYVFTSRQTGDRGTTSDVAALVCFFLGVLVAEGMIAVAVGAGVLLVVLLRSKETLHALSARFSDTDVRVVLQFAVITAVVLPLLPDRGFGPFEAINPYEIWLMVALVSGIGLVGYVALRIWGERGVGAAGLLGGLVSSTAVAFAYGRLARRQRELASIAGAAVVAASGMMFLRVVVEAAVVEPQLAAVVALPAGVIGVGLIGVAGRPLVRSFRNHAGAEELSIRNPLSLAAALTFGAVYGAIAFTGEVLREMVGDASLVALGAVSGLVDVDAITLLVANLVGGGLDPATGGLVVMVAAAVNTGVKAAIAVSLGGRVLAKPVLGVLIPAAVAAVVAGLAL